jgi:ElaB/YqjD/DUF883 family membrane-anchored ribosome-binding protein
MSDSPGGAARGMGERVQQTVSDTIDDTKTAAAGVYNQAARIGDVIKEQPIVAVLIALGIGYLLGRLTA